MLKLLRPLVIVHLRIPSLNVRNIFHPCCILIGQFHSTHQPHARHLVSNSMTVVCILVFNGKVMWKLSTSSFLLPRIPLPLSLPELMFMLSEAEVTLKTPISQNDQIDGSLISRTRYLHIGNRHYYLGRKPLKFAIYEFYPTTARVPVYFNLILFARTITTSTACASSVFLSTLSTNPCTNLSRMPFSDWQHYSLSI